MGCRGTRSRDCRRSGWPRPAGSPSRSTCSSPAGRATAQKLSFKAAFLWFQNTALSSLTQHCPVVLSLSTTLSFSHSAPPCVRRSVSELVEKMLEFIGNNTDVDLATAALPEGDRDL